MDPIWKAQYDSSVPAHLDYPRGGLSDLLISAGETHPDRPALIYYGRRLTYRQVTDLVSRFAGALGEWQIGRRSVVGIMLPNLPQTVIAFYGSLHAGAAVTPINPLYVEGEIERQITDAGCDTLVALDQFLPRIEPLLGRTSLKRVIVTGPEDYLPWLKRVLYPWMKRGSASAPRRSGSAAVHSWRRIIKAAPAPRAAVAQEDIALLQYTGGTTGIPKGVVLTHRNLVCNTWQCRHWMPSLRGGQEIILGVLPFFHVYGMSACQNLAISVGAALVLLPRFQVSEVLSAITRERVTVFPGIPAMYSAINNYQRLDRYDLRSIRLCISGAGPLHDSVQERFEALTGARLVEGYGLTEAGPVTHINPVEADPSRRRRRSIGLPLPDTEAKIMDVETGEQELRAGEIGELTIRGPQVMQGYWKRDDETRHVLKAGWLYTGDLARMDGDGFFYIEDRKKDMIKSGGENVYPREVEEILYRHPKVKEAVVVGLPLGIRGELIKAYVILKEGETATAAELLEHCRKDLAKFKVPKKIEFRNELPKSLVGKVLRRMLLEEERQKGRVLSEEQT
ncbi:MAG TPA: long-chain fatty acid--CoA ligase [Nitrospiraceae bacterium]|nr:long-chain fatty acid--CoA ligase [Nitrospiraceae bacterium]